MTPDAEHGHTKPGTAVLPGMRVVGASNARIGTVDAVFVDYLLVRTSGVLPVDLYIPSPFVEVESDTVRIDCGRREAYERWHRPLKRAPHPDG